MGARIRHAHPSAIADLAADFPDLAIIRERIFHGNAERILPGLKQHLESS